MKADDFEALARKAGLAKHGLGWTAWESQLERFAKLVEEHTIKSLAQPEQEPVLHKWAALFEDPNNDWQAGYESARRWVLEVGLQSIAAPPQRKPLTEEQILQCFHSEVDSPVDVSDAEMIDFARAIEKAHGIGGEHE